MHTLVKISLAGGVAIAGLSQGAPSWAGKKDGMPRLFLSKGK